MLALLAQTPPPDPLQQLITLISSIPWTNGQGLVTGAVLLSVFTAVVTVLTSLSTRTTTNTTGISTLNNQVAGNTSSLSTLGGQVATNTSGISTLTGQVASNTSGLSTLGSQVTGNTSSISTLGSQVAGNTSNISTLTGQTATLSTQSATMAGQIAAMQAFISQLPADLPTQLLTMVRKVQNIDGPEVYLNRAALGMGQFAFTAITPFFLDFSQGAVPSGASVSGDVTGSRTDNTGTRILSAVAPRFDYSAISPFPSQGLLVERATTNLIRNNTNQGAVTGTLGSGGALPTNWSVNSAGLAVDVTAVTVAGIPRTRLRFYGTSNNTTINIFKDTSTGIPAAQNDVMAAREQIAISAGTTNGIVSHRLIVNENIAGGGSPSVNVGASTLNTPTSTLTVYTNTYTLASAATAFAQPGFRIIITSGAAIDITYDLGIDQLERNPISTTTVFTSGTTASRTATVLQYTVPSGVNLLTTTFDDGSTQTATVASGPLTVDPTTLSRPRIMYVSAQSIVPVLQA